ncbi:MAG: transcriptional repressor [Ruminococcaceae bacterium]|nr:transcriptional repressor [Oscillospiraceae bacterium]
MEAKTYKTRQRSSLLKFFEEHKDSCFTAKELIKNVDISLGEATIYRSLAKFEKDGTIRKFISPGSDGAFYQYSGENKECSSHFHLKCTSCGTLIHMDCQLMNEIKTHISLEHNFTIDNAKTTLYGLCDRCNIN